MSRDQDILILGSVICLICIWIVLRAFQINNPNQIMGVIYNGDSTSVNWYTTPGVKWQGFGKVFVYPKSKTYVFRVPVRFEGCDRTVLAGSLEYKLPLDDKNLNRLHSSYGSASFIESKLIAPLVCTSIYNAGSLIGTRDSYVERDSLLGVPMEKKLPSSAYQPVPREVKVVDLVTGEGRVMHTFDILVEDSLILRQEDPLLENYGVTVSNFTVKELPASFIEEF